MVTQCLIDTCESLTPWSWSNRLTPSIDTVTKKEGTGSIKVYKGAPSGGPTQQFSREFAQCDLYFGIWLRAYFTSVVGGFTLSIRQANHTNAYINIGSAAVGLPYPCTGGVQLLGSGGAGVSIGTLAPNTWAWFEIYTDSAKITYFRNNGVAYPPFSGWLIWPTLNLYYNCGDYMDAQTVWLDYAKWGNAWEYPPKPPSLKLHPFWKLKT
jgi:hypothetical protein